MEKNHLPAFTEIALLGPAHFYSGAFSTDELARRFDDTSTDNSKYFLILRTLGEVQKYGATTRRWQAEREKHRAGERFDSLVLSSLALERAAWTRRLVEALVTLVNFSNTNTDEYFAHYLATQRRDRERAEAKDEEDFFGAASELTKRKLSKLEQSVDSARSQLGSNPDCWYLAQNKSYRSATFRDQYLRALSLALPAEKTALGYTYRSSFGDASEQLHFSVVDSPDETPSESHPGDALCGLLCVAIICRAHELTGVTPGEFNATLMRPENRNRPVSALLSNRAVVGDYVLIAGPHVAEVLEIRQGKFDYESYRLKFLDTSTGPGIDEDWLPAPAVSLYMVQADLHQQVVANLKQRGCPLPSQSELKDVCRQSVIEAWRLGARDFVIGLSTKKDA